MENWVTEDETWALFEAQPIKQENKAWLHPSEPRLRVVRPQLTDKKTLLHCQVNARATAFSFLYRVLYEEVPVAEAKADMNTVWQPNEVWRDFIFEVMEQSGADPNCEGCDWTLPPPRGQ